MIVLTAPDHNVRILPTAAPEPVRQARHYGRYPKHIPYLPTVKRLRAKTPGDAAELRNENEGLLVVHISPTVERDYRRRGVFRDLSLDRAARIEHGFWGTYFINADLAREVWKDAQDRLAAPNGESSRGLRSAYEALSRNTSYVLTRNAERENKTAPEVEEVVRQRAAASACLSVGERVLYFRPGSAVGREAMVTGKYQMYKVWCPDGPHIDVNDYRRFAYVMGYAVLLDGAEESTFACAHDLTRYDCKPSHLQLVTADAQD